MNPHDKYKTAAASTANPKSQLIFVYDEIIKSLHNAKKAMSEQNYEDKFNHLTRVTDVLYTLRPGDDVGDDENLEKIEVFYMATINKLENINMSGEDPAELDVIIEAFGSIRDTLQDPEKFKEGSDSDKKKN
jgi:flagellar biosynthetic protein FliS